VSPVGDPLGRNGVLDLQLEGVGLEVRGLRPFWGVDVHIEVGVPVVVTGPSGSGKTLFCMVLAGLIPPTSGDILLGGRPLNEGTAPRGGVVLQDHGLVSGLTAFENVALPLQERRMNPSEITERSRTALIRVGLTDEVDRSVDDLSGGEQQRVGIARAIAGDPAVLVADEPTSELDPENRERVLGLLIDESRRTTSVVVVASDDPEVVKHFERIFVLGDATVAEVKRERPEQQHEGNPLLP
jgi:putative ABC transport system ATP-binding protein